MASYTTNFSSWSGFEGLLTAAQGFEASPTYGVIKSSLQSLQDHIAQDFVFQEAISGGVRIYWADGVQANVLGYLFGTTAATITHIDVSDGTSTINLDGVVGYQNLGIGAFNSYSYTGFGYTESGNGQIPVNGNPAVLSDWTQTVPTAQGNVTLAATGTSTVSAETVSITYSSIAISDGSGHSAQLGGLNYYVSGGASSAPDYVQIMHDMLAGNDLGNGTSGAEELRGFAGNDSLDGGAGNDAAIFSETRAQYTVLPVSTGWTISGPDGFDTLTGIEFARFADQTIALFNYAPAGLVTISGVPSQNQTLTAGNTLNDQNGLGTISYQWNANGTPISGATAGTFVLTQAQAGKIITVTASYSDGLGALESVTSGATGAVANVNDAPGGSVTVSGTATQNQILTAANTLADIDGLGSITYQWKADNVAISGANAATLTLAQAQVGKAITVTASYTDGQGTAEAVTSIATGVVGNVNDAPVVAAQGNRSAGLNEAVSLNMGMVFSDPDSDILSFAATGLPAGLAIDGASGLISGTAPGVPGVHHVTVTGTDTSNASASANFDLNILVGHTVTTSILTRGGALLPGVAADEFISATPGSSLYGFRNIAVDTNAVTGIKTLTADLVSTGIGTELQSAFSLHEAGGANLQSFQLTGAVTGANGWSINESHPSGGYALTATHVSSSIAAGSIIGKLTMLLPANAAGNGILDFTDASLGNSGTPNRSVSYSQENAGVQGQLGVTLPDSNLALSFSRGTTDYLVNGTAKPVTAADALDALKLSVGLPATKGNSWKELIAADMNHDGRVTAADALEILKVSVGVNTIQPSWVFVPNDASVNPNLASMTKTTVSYRDELNFAAITEPASATVTGILVGDVNNSWVIPA